MSLPTTYRKLVAVNPSMNFHEAVEVQEVPLTEPEADEILVKTAYTGVNAADYLMAAGRYLSQTPPPFDLGAESSGTIAAVGSDVTNFNIGDAVLVVVGGGYREYFTIKASRAIPIPKATAEAVTIGISGLTASIALEEVGKMGTNETVLVTAAAGGTGNFVVQLAKIAGNRVIGTCGSDEKVDFLKAIGCDRPINYKTETFSEVLKTEYPKGVDLVFESVGGAMFDTAVNALAIKGRLIIIGSISEYKTGPQPITDIRISYKLLQKSASLHGMWLVHFFRDTPKHIVKLMQLIGDGTLKTFTDPSEFYGVEGAIGALEHMYNGHNVGKVVVRFEG